MNVDTGRPVNRWTEAWPDALAFAVGLAIPWFASWDTADLIWSLWLSSLVLGYAMIVWSIFSRAWGSVSGMVGGVFLLAFFTVHFGLFHFVHSLFVNQFFPLEPGTARGAPDYFEVLSRYGIWLPVAFFAERSAFRRPPPRVMDRTSVKAKDIAARKARDNDTTMIKPYANVIRLHLLIFFFAFTHFMKLDGFLVYAVVYAVYFFPWRLVLRKSTPRHRTG